MMTGTEAARRMSRHRSMPLVLGGRRSSRISAGAEASSSRTSVAFGGDADVETFTPQGRHDLQHRRLIRLDDDDPIGA